MTLVFQQFAVLENNLDQKIEHFCGEMGCDLWSKETWTKHFSENEVIVCTAEILNQCLMHSFISIDDINLLVFDEAHHTKKNHAYARFVSLTVNTFVHIGVYRFIELSKITTLPKRTQRSVQRYLV